MNTKEQKAQNDQEKKQYTKPEVKKLGRLSTLIQGSSGTIKDNFPMPGVHK